MRITLEASNREAALREAELLIHRLRAEVQAFCDRHDCGGSAQAAVGPIDLVADSPANQE
jgi:hypothetical protein